MEFASHLRIITRVSSYYVQNVVHDEVLAGPFPNDGKARNALIMLDGKRYVPEEINNLRGCDTRYGIWDTHEKVFIGLDGDESEIFITADLSSAAYTARGLNDYQRNDSRLNQYRERHPVNGERRSR
jgi:hypothetical protein